MNYQLLAELATMAASFEEVCKEFALTPEQMKDPKAGKFIVERIHNIQTAYNVRTGLSDKTDFTKTHDPFKKE